MSNSGPPLAPSEIERVVRGARALYMGGHGGWTDCFLAIAYGEAGELDRVMPQAVPSHITEEAMRGWERYYALKAQPSSALADDVLVDSWTVYDSVASLLGISFEHVDVVTRCFDTDPETFTAELVRWLRDRGANAHVVLGLVACEAEAGGPRDQRLGP